MEKSDYKVYKNTPAVYLIRCVPTNKVYIGSTLTLKKRFRNYFSKLSNKSHENLYLQNTWNKYGKENFGISYQSMWDLIRYRTYKHLTPKNLRVFELAGKARGRER